VDFDGLVELSAALLAGEPGIAAGLRARWPFVSVDEYQDIDAVQYDLLRAISGDGAGLTAIGDPDQAIYGFRGADVGIFGRFAADFPGRHHGGADQELPVEPGHRDRRDAGHRARDAGAGPGRPRPRPWRPVTRSPATFPSTRRPMSTPRRRGSPRPSTSCWAVRRSTRLDSGRADGHGHGKLGLSDIAVLYRTDAQAGALGQALTRAGLPYQKRSHDLLARRPAVSDIMREMASLDRRRIAAAWSGQLTAAVKAAGRWPRRAASGTRRWWTSGPRARCWPRWPAGAATTRSGSAPRSLGAETDALDPRAEAVTLLTLHGSKGLEFDVVFLAGCERGLLPLRRPGSGPLTPDETAEERRLLFVGMTRARGQLCSPARARRTRHGAEEAAGRSPFLAAVSTELLGAVAAPRARRTGDRQLRLL
jgi:DNA helicase-2/ATP-dependent DNA helicase PcrA